MLPNALRQRVELSIPRKQGAASMGRPKALKRFYDAVARAMVQHIDFSLVKCVLVASPGFVKDDLMAHLNSEASRPDLKPLAENKNKLVLCHCSTGHKHSLKEVLEDPGVSSRLKDTKAMEEVAALSAFFKMLNVDSDRTAYGEAYVLKAEAMGAISVLLISDNLFRSPDPNTRKRFVQLVDNVRGGGGQVHILSTMHCSGEQLQQLSGVAAILRFPLPELDEEVALDEEEDDSDEELNLLELLAPSPGRY